MQQAEPSELTQVNQVVKGKKTPLAIVLEPTRELAIQTHEEFKKFQKYLPPPQIDLCMQLILITVII
jgi:superfamily II DNA/RNA helicase